MRKEPKLHRHILAYWKYKTKDATKKLEQVAEVMEIGKAIAKSEAVKQHLEEERANKSTPDKAEKEIPEDADFHLDSD